MPRFTYSSYVLGVALTLSACGTVVPDLNEAPVASGDEQLLVQSIVISIKCEISNAVNDFIDADIHASRFNHGHRQAAWLDAWGAQVALSLKVEEKTSINPTIAGLPNPIFTIGITGNASADATRSDRGNYFFKVADLRAAGRCTSGLQPSQGSSSLLIQPTLKTANWLFDQIALGATDEVIFPKSVKGVFKQNVISHDVTFEIINGIGVTPSWKYAHVNVDTSGIFGATTRDRTSELIITFGPLDPTQDNSGLIPEAEEFHQAQIEASAIK